MFPKLLESKEVRADISRYQDIIDKITAVNSKSQMEDALHKYVQKLNEMDMWHTFYLPKCKQCSYASQSTLLA